MKSAPAVVLGDVRTVLELASSPMRDGKAWTVEESNDIAHLIQTVGLIQRSEWWQTTPSFTRQGERFELAGPTAESAIIGIVLLRQLLPGKDLKPGIDDSFRHAAKLYCDHVDSDIKRIWVTKEVESFERILQSEGFPFPSSRFGLRSICELLELFIYGTGLIHRRSAHDREEELARLRSSVHLGEFRYAFEAAARSVLSIAINTCVLIYRDFAYWTNECGCPRPSRVVAEYLVGCQSTPTNAT